MKKFMMLLLISMLAAFMAACGTENTGEENTAGEQNQEESTEEAEAPEDTVEEENEEETVEETESETDSEDIAEEEPAEEEVTEEGTEEADSGEGKVRLLEQPMTFTINGEETERTAFLQESEENNYSLYVADGFTFTPEEPNVDQIYFDEDGSQFMRVHTYPVSESEAALIEDQMKGQAEAIQGEEAADWMPEDASHDMIAGYEAAVGDDQFKTYLYEIDDMYVRIAIHAKADSGLENAFLQMAETIE
ncbi:hypothetical protein [Jeotgalibacillus salarius]|uniref:DUF4367 domain-containing protein n=1 Tax=Jeotgalibacillus salarius TaxID=546023 RepID=A0A4Y8LD29_9BACL|nr:hypothetical protein [Jeotgalibacillus salarius]TFE00338.1 hypothetical protein E2626_12725 [Jeotgalibacillus salarius]